MSLYELPHILIATGAVVAGYGLCARGWRRIAIVLAGIALVAGAEPIGLRALLRSERSRGFASGYDAHFLGRGPRWIARFHENRHDPATVREAHAVADEMEQAIALGWEDLAGLRVEGEMPNRASWPAIYESLSSLPPQRDLIEVLGAERAERLTGAAGELVAASVREVHDGWWMDGFVGDLPAAIVGACLRDRDAADLLFGKCCGEIVATRLHPNSGRQLLLMGLANTRIESLGLDVHRLAWVDARGEHHDIPVAGIATTRRYGAVISIGYLEPPEEWDGKIFVEGQWILDDGLRLVGVRSDDAVEFGDPGSYFVEVRSEIVRAPSVVPTNPRGVR